MCFLQRPFGGLFVGSEIGMDINQVDLSQALDEDSFQSLIVSVFGFPPYYGKNLDAFWDCLSDFVTSPAKAILVGYDVLNPTMKRYVDRYIELLKEFEQERSTGFVVEFANR